MATEKIANYTPEQTAMIVDAYTAQPTEDTVKSLADQFGKSVRSIVAKLSREGVYTSKAKTAGKRPMLKAEMISKLATLTGASEDQLESLEKATGSALMLVIKALEAGKAE